MLFKSLKTKLILLFSLIVILLSSVTAFLLIEEKKLELRRDIYLRGKAFAELSTIEIINSYENLLAEGAFYLFNSKIIELFNLNEDIYQIKIASFDGKLLYDSLTENIDPYAGAERIIRDRDLLSRIRSQNISLLATSGRTIFLKKDLDNSYAVDLNEKLIPEISDEEKIINIVMPYRNYAVIFSVTYGQLESRVLAMQNRIILLAVFGILLGICIGLLASNSVTRPLTTLKETVLKIALGNFSDRVQIKSKDEIGSLAESVNKMAGDLEKSTKALIYKERVAKELELAAKLQQKLVPEFLPKVNGLSVAAGLLPAAEVGGDLYDFITLKDGRLISYVGDVTGHGVPAGIIGAVANALIYGYAGNIDIKEILIQTNRILHSKSSQNMFLTMVISEWNPSLKAFNFVSAGHERIIHYKKSKNEAVLLPQGGLALGMMPDISNLLKTETVTLESGDLIILYTDGIPEAWKDKEMYGIDRFKNAITRFSDLKTAEAIKNSIIADVRNFIYGYKQMDDITLIVYLCK